MHDFAIIVSGLPKNIEFGSSEEILRAKLWTHFLEIG